MTDIEWHIDIINAFKANNIRMIAHVADTVLAPIISAMENDSFFRVVTLSREEEGVGLLTGAYLGGMRGALLLQASGLGNTINAFGSLAIPYQIPFVVLLSQRGSFFEHNIVQIAGGKATDDIFRALDIQTFDLVRPDEVAFVAERGMRHAFVARKPVALTITTQLSGGKHGNRAP
jgi:sulfopyruvate decarboxylase alpha subunit